MLTCPKCLALDALSEVERINKEESSGERAYDLASLARGYGYFRATLIRLTEMRHMELCASCAERETRGSM
jgi:hypothetical protein